jgi:hypothetical protein
MSFEIENHHVIQFHKNLEFENQQKKSRLEECCTTKPQSVKVAFHHSLGVIEAETREDENGDTKWKEIQHKRRMVIASPEDIPLILDEADEEEVVTSPKSAYIEATNFGINRKQDRIVTEAAFRTSFIGKNGATPVEFPDINIIESLNSGLTLDKLIQAKEMLDQYENPEELKRYIWCGTKQTSNLLKDSKLTSKEYAEVKALVKGEISFFMGFNFKKNFYLEKEGDDRACVAMVQGGIILGQGKLKNKIDVLPMKNYSTGIWTSKRLGATRGSEEKIIKILCKEI